MLAIITAIHLAALSQIESGDRDRIIGRAGEVSRWQIMPEVARRQLKLCPELRTQPYTLTDLIWNADAARIIVASEWESRAQAFQTQHLRAPTVPELYLLWHRPARVLAPKPAELERARRFENIVRKLTAAQPKAKP